ncbi:MAG: hypothetical protein QOF48_3322 [Verrucomicrobiota bacterium]|jgi:hypothetical protein
MDEIDLIIDVRGGDDSDLRAFLSERGVRARPYHGIFNGPIPAEILNHPAPYVWATATGIVLRAAIRAYADCKKQRLTVHRSKTGVKVDATNYSVDELKDLDSLDICKFEKPGADLK